jgi:protocatechuate 3,4-dioxygenase beta subunit
VFAGQRGEYHLESNVPVSYGCRPPHIHVRVRAPSHEELVTQQYLLQRLGIVERLGGGHLSV